jgi:hypothetical protein
MRQPSGLWKHPRSAFDAAIPRHGSPSADWRSLDRAETRTRGDQGGGPGTGPCSSAWRRVLPWKLRHVTLTFGRDRVAKPDSASSLASSANRSSGG